MKKYRIITIPSSDDEKDFENIIDFKGAEKHIKKNENLFCTGEHSFDTKEELEAFIKGYESAIGFLGGGLFFTNEL